MLAYLDALYEALKHRDVAEVYALLQHPLASALPAGVIDEAQRIASGDADEHAAPVQTRRLYHQTAHLLGVCADPVSKRRNSGSFRAVGERVGERPIERPRQMELELPQRAAVA